MRFQHSVKITADNFGSVFKFLLYRVITGLVFFSIIYVILRLSLSFIVESAEVAALRDLVVDTVKSIISGNTERLKEIQDGMLFSQAIVDLGKLVASGGGAIAGAVVGVCLIYIAARIVDGLATFTMATTLNDRMSICARTPFSSAFFQSAGKGIFYELIYVPLSFVYDVCSILLCYFIFFYLRGLIFNTTFLVAVMSLSLAGLSFILLETLKMTLISAWIPAMVADKMKVTKAFQFSMKNKEGFGARFACFLTSIFIIVVTNIVFAVCTLGSALFITLPLSFLFVLAIQFVFYYQSTGKKYFIGRGEIIVPEEKGAELKEINL